MIPDVTHYDRTLRLVTGDGGAVIRITCVKSRSDGGFDAQELGFALTPANLRKLEHHLRKARITRRKITTLRY